jgi:Icc-related predicted phosphoesterase
MLLVADVHGARRALARVAGLGEPLLVLGDLINFIDYRTYGGIVCDVIGIDFVRAMVARRDSGDYDGARALWREVSAGREREIRQTFDEHIAAAYVDICKALEGADAYVTYGNVDQPEILAAHLPAGTRFVDAEVVEIDGCRVGFAGGGIVSANTPGEITEDDMADKLDRLGRVDVLCTHSPPALAMLSTDVIGGRQKGSAAIVDYLHRARPVVHYFGDIHQPQAVSWRVGSTLCRNVGYFRATGKAVRHGG